MKPNSKFGVVMNEYKHHHLHSGSKNGPIVKSRAQAQAIAASEQRRADMERIKRHQQRYRK